MEHQESQKITAHLPKHLLEEAQKFTGKGITETLKQALEQFARNEAYLKLAEMKGSHRFTIDLDELRKDRR